jgi:hypothetical protein
MSGSAAGGSAVSAALASLSTALRLVLADAEHPHARPPARTEGAEGEAAGVLRQLQALALRSAPRGGDDAVALAGGPEGETQQAAAEAEAEAEAGYDSKRLRRRAAERSKLDPWKLAQGHIRGLGMRQAVQAWPLSLATGSLRS